VTARVDVAPKDAHEAPADASHATTASKAGADSQTRASAGNYCGCLCGCAPR
jgi:hypothetical protein